MMFGSIYYVGVIYDVYLSLYLTKFITFNIKRWILLFRIKYKCEDEIKTICSWYSIQNWRLL